MANFFSIALITFVVLKGCHATYQFDLFKSVGLPGNATSQGLTVTSGSSFIDFSKFSGKPIFTNSDEVGFISHAFMNSDDISFAVTFIISKMEEGKTYTFFAINDNNKEYLKIGLDFERGGTVEGDVVGKVQPVLKYGANEINRPIGLPKLSKEIGKEVTLIVRFQNVGESDTKRKRRAALTSKIQNLTVSINCEVVVEQSISPPFFGKSNAFPLYGNLTVGMSFNPNDENVQNVFQGNMSNPVILTNKLAFELLNPCTTLPRQVVPSEPLPDDYDPSFFEKFVKMTSSGLRPIVLDCTEPGTKKRRYNGEEWYERGRCLKKTCNGGVIKSAVECDYVCTIEGKDFYTGENFTRPNDPCLIYKCKLDRPNGTFVAEVKCENNLDCDKYGKEKPDGECCDKCKSDTCTKENTVYSENCDRKCGVEQCATMEPGCYCKTGYVLDENDNCIKESDCTCKVDSKVYQPKERVRKSRYEECICLRGSLECSTIQP